jgi:lipid II:glycine glycyltransferase (peptidoglycan interpeptide bridge formation enzyme)
LPWHDHDAVQVFFDYLKEFATEKQVDFVRLSPMAKNTPENLAVLKSHGYRAAPMHVLAENSWLLDLTDSEDELMRNMKKNHRNLIRRCIKEGVIVTKEGKAGLSHVHDLLDETAKRLNFHRFSRTYIDQEFDAFAPDHVETFVARLPDGRVDAAAVIMFYGTMAVYRHSGSLGLDRKVPTSYLIQWEVIKEAKKRDMSWYNFWGVEPKDASKNHPFAGIGHFKRGFGGEQFDLIHCHDLPITPKYWFNYTVEMIRKWKRGF